MAKKKAKKKATKKKATKKKTSTPRPEGKLSGLGVVATWVKLFKENVKKKLTDEEISKAMHKNFPDKASKIFDHPSVVRYRYNAGALTQGEVPATPSVRYDEDGKVITRKVKKVKKVKKAKKKSKKKGGFIRSSDQQRK